MKFLSRKVLLFAFVSLTIAFVTYLFWPSGKLSFRLSEYRNLYDVNDIGIADLQQNGVPVRWTTNHSSSQFFDIDPQNSDIFTGLDELNLHQDANIPGFEPGLYELPWTKPVRLYIKDQNFVIESNESLSGEIIEGSLQIPWESEAFGEGEVQVGSVKCPQQKNSTYINYKIYGKGKILIKTIPERSNGFPVEFTFSENTNLDIIQMGRIGIPPPSHSFVYHSKDRHGFALRYNDSGHTEVFVSRGGARGRLETAHPGAKDELFRLEDGKYQDVILQYGIEKDGCPGRQTAWFDVNADGLLDLYQVCGRGKGAEDGEKATCFNRLYVQNNTGLFEEQASKYGIDFPEIGSFKFIYLEDDVGNFDLFMVWVTSSKFEVYTYAKDQQKYNKVYSKSRTGTGKDKLSIGDRDGNGVWEVMVFSPKGNMYVELENDEITELSLKELGLPEKSQDGSFIDLDGNGYQDVFCVPQGIFENKSGKFEAVGKPNLSWVNSYADVRFAWFDYDDDGDMDLWVSSSLGTAPTGSGTDVIDSYFSWAPVFMKPFLQKVSRRLGFAETHPSYWESRLYENLSQQKSMLVHFRGPPGNLSAIGSQITLIDEKSGQNRHYYVGWSDHSRFSQTWNDIYVMKTDEKGSVSLRVKYPDGKVFSKDFDTSEVDKLSIEYH